VIVDEDAPPWLMLIALGEADRPKSGLEANTEEEIPRVSAVEGPRRKESKNARKRTDPTGKTYL
jgi:hypothetical protein